MSTKTQPSLAGKSDYCCSRHKAMRMETLKHTPMAMISRGVCGIRSGALIINLPGSPKGVKESFAVIAPVLNHAVALLAGKAHNEAQ